MATWMYVVRPTRLGMVTEGPTDEEQALVGQHFAHLMAAGERGQVLVFGRTGNNDERTFGIVVFEAGDEAAADAFVRSDPAVAGGVMTGELFPYRLAFFAGRSSAPA